MSRLTTAEHATIEAAALILDLNINAQLATDLRAIAHTPEKLDPAGNVVIPASLIERRAVHLLNALCVHSDESRPGLIPDVLRLEIDALLTCAELRRSDLSPAWAPSSTLAHGGAAQ